VKHGKTLKRLLVVNGTIHRQDQDRCCDAGDLPQSATACTELEQLCLNLYELDTDRNESDFLGPLADGLFTPSAFEEALVAIAGMPKLHTLRLTNPPNYRKAYRAPGDIRRNHERQLQAGSERYAFRARADALMQFMGERASNVKHLAFRPVETLATASRPDMHGHVWPNYFYSRLRMVDADGRVMHVARPVASF